MDVVIVTLMRETLGNTIKSMKAICKHQIKRGFGPLRHNLHFLCHGFQTKERAGWYYNPRKQLLMVYSFFRAGYPDYAVGSSVMLVKSFFVLPFVLEDMIDRKKRGG